MAQGNRRDEKMRSDRGEWDRKRTGFGNTDKRKKFQKILILFRSIGESIL